MSMRVHPPVSMKRSQNLTLMDPQNTSKKLRRLPHVFSKVLELPFPSDADVSVEERSDCLVFVAEIDGDVGDIKAHAVEIHSGVVKVVIRRGDVVELLLDDLKVDVWRIRLPASTMPEMATAVLVDQKLIVTVPKRSGGEFETVVWGGVGRFVLVQ